MKTAILVALMVCSFNTFAEKPDCAGEMTVAGLTCLNPNGGNDVRLYITEFQTCQNDKIIEFERSVLGMRVVSPNSVDDIHTIGEENMTIEYNSQRTMIDPGERADNLSFFMPKTAKIIDGDATIEMIVTDELEPDYEGALSTHFKGSFTITKTTGKTSKGKLICSVTR